MATIIERLWLERSNLHLDASSEPVRIATTVRLPGYVSRPPGDQRLGRRRPSWVIDAASRPSRVRSRPGEARRPVTSGSGDKQELVDAGRWNHTQW